MIRPDGSKLRGKFSLETFEEMTPAAFQLEGRLRAMDELGLTMQILYPNVLGFAGASIMRLTDVELRNFCTYAYNDAGDLYTVTYNDGTTPGVTYTYDRRGRQKTVVCNGITTTLTFNDAN